ncbi:Retrovirus-related Pol polyprotein from transposon.6 [Sesamum angolense]|uniref:Retrovirus-related Pol polyprotein from transposon.6 n=1 Tax=Sesamum angolense TaxID=2727404 RepID=A0AAE1W932_9LAMI|nr:Retrovirus-related Pol polyprotein from transposon.6 [Sesamum angolense]
MNDVLYEYLDRFVVVYLDDIVIYSETLNEHVKHLRAAFQKLREYELYAKKEKCEFCCEKITFLGYVISQGQIQMDRKKAVHQGILENCKPLDGLAEEGSEVGVDCCLRDAFKLLKQAISSQPDKHPIAFESRKLKDAELRYSTHEKEMTTVVHCLEAWRHYLLGTKFTVVTDNVSNTYFKTQRKLSPKQARWQEFLGEFDFEWMHRPGKHNDVADALSQKLVEEYVKSGLVRKYWLDSGLLYAKGGRVFVPTGTLRRRLLRETHDPQWAGYPGIDRMIALLARRYYWPRMKEDVEACTDLSSLSARQSGKKERGRVAATVTDSRGAMAVRFHGLYYGFPKMNGMASVLVVVDRFSKDARFTGRFWTALFNMMGTELKFSTAQSSSDRWPDGEGECVGEDYLRHYVSASQRNWVDLLDVAQFSYNLHKSSATGMSPFELAYGQQPTTPYEIAVQRTGGKCPAAYRRHVEFSAGDQVLLKLTPQIWKKISSKSVHRGLIPKYDGPFEVMSKVGWLAYHLKLPDRLKIHPTFHVSFLKKFHQDLLDAARRQTQRAPPVIRKEFEKMVLKILDHRTMG